MARSSNLLPVAWLLLAALAAAQPPQVHYQSPSTLPPGAIGSWQLQRGGPVAGYYQPVEILAPPGVHVATCAGGEFVEGVPAPTRVGLLIGAVYRLRITGIPLREGEEVYPTIELIDRLYTPRGQEMRFAIPIELTQEDLELALAGKFVTRVVYLEDPQTAVPAHEPSGRQQWLEAAVEEDPVELADTLGRPVAIVRMGGRLPTGGFDARFFYGCPPYLPLPPRATTTVAPAVAPPVQSVVPPAPLSTPPQGQPQ